MTAESVTIPSRFNGPPGSANGGYACGVTARLLTGEGIADQGVASEGGAEAGAAAVQVTLRQPPPVDKPLRVEREPARVAILDGDQVVTEAVYGKPPSGLPVPVSLDRAMEAAKSFDTVTYAERHPFPRCFTCGPARGEEDGLRIFPAPAPNGDGRPLVVWPWTPDGSLGADDGSGLVDLPVVWAALDCPSGLARFADESNADPGDQVASVLGRMTTTVYRRPATGQLTVASGWAVADEGRKLLSGAAVWTATGEVLAAAETVWIILTEEQRAAFNVASG